MGGRFHILCAQCVQPSAQRPGKPSNSICLICAVSLEHSSFLVTSTLIVQPCLAALWYRYLCYCSFPSVFWCHQVKEPESKSVLGMLTLPLVRLMNTSDLSLDQRFQLERSGANSQIKIKATLRVSTSSHAIDVSLNLVGLSDFMLV